MKTQKPRNQNLTIPNMLSVLRIVMVPFFAVFFLKDNIKASIIVLLLSGLSDAVDGFIARKFNQITELGKILDPFADKITQGIVAICVGIKYPIICPVLVIFIVKELGMLVLGSILIKNKKKPGAAKWYGKVGTILFYTSIVTIVGMDMLSVAANVFTVVSYVLLALTAAMMVYAAYEYFLIYRRLIKSDDPEDYLDWQEEIRQKA